MDRQRRRVLRLRTHVLNHETRNLIKDIEVAHGLAVDEDEKINEFMSIEDEAVVRESKLSELTVKQLNEVARDSGIVGYSNMNKEELIEKIEEL